MAKTPHRDYTKEKIASPNFIYLQEKARGPDDITVIGTSILI